MKYTEGMNCWDFFQCGQKDKKRCPAYTKKCGEKCWECASGSTEIVNSGVSVADGIKECWNCGYFYARHSDIFDKL